MKSATSPVPDLHLRLSKKIAQLTKVVYQLKTRGDEAERESRALESEIDDVVRDAASKLTQFRDNFEAERAKQQGEMTAEAVSKEKERHKKEMEEMCSRWNAANQEIAQKAKDMEDKLKEELKELRQEFSDRMGEVERRRKEDVETEKKDGERLRNEEKEELKRKHLLELDTLNEKLKKEMEMLREECKRQVEKAQSEMEEMRVRNENSENDWKRKMNEMEAHWTKNVRETSDATRDHIASEKAELEGRLRREMEELERRLKQRDEEIEKLRNNLTANESKIGDLTKNISDLGNANKIAAEHAVVLEEELSKQRERAELAESKLKSGNESACAEKEDQRRKLEEKLTFERNQFDKIISDLKNSLETSETALMKANEVNSSLQLQLRESKTENDTLNRKCEQLQHRMESIAANSAGKDADMKQLEREHIAAIEAIKISAKEAEIALKKVVQELEKSLAAETQKREDIEKQKKEELQKLRDELEHQVSRISQSHHDSMLSLQQQLATKEALLEEKNGQLKQSETKTETVITKESEYLHQIARLNKEAEKLKSKINQIATQHQDSLNALQEKIHLAENQLRITLEEKESVLKTSESKRIEFETRIIALQQAAKDRAAEVTRVLNEQWSGILKERENALNTEMKQRIAHEQELANMKLSSVLNEERNANEKKLRLLIDDWERRLAASNAACSRANEDRLNAEVTVVSLKEQTKALQEKCESIRNESISSMEKLQQETNQRIAAMETKHKEEMDTAKRDSEQKINILKREHEAMVDDINKRHNKDIDALRERNEKERVIEREQLLQEAEKAKKVAVQNALSDAEKLHSQNISERETKTNEILQKASQLESEISALTAMKCVLEEQLLSAKSDCEKKNAQLEMQVNQLQSQLASLVESSERELRTQINGLMTAHREEKERIVKLSNETSAAMELRYKSLKERFEDLEITYNGRPPRQEDVARIRELEEQVVKLQAAIQKVQEESKFLRLELINREEVYNKVFTASRGVTQPMALPVGNSALSMNSTSVSKPKHVQTPTRLEPINPSTTRGSNHTTPPSTTQRQRSKGSSESHTPP